MSSFSGAEYERRFERVRSLMAERSIDALLVSNTQNVAYLAGTGSFDHSWAMHFMEPIAYASVVVVPKAGRPMLIVHDVFKDVLYQARSISDVRVYYERGPDEEQPYVGMAVQALKDLECSKGAIGIELGCGYMTDPKLGMPLANLLRIEQELPDAKFVDCSEILRIVRMTKSKVEIEHIRKATEAIDKTFDVCFETISPGMSETEIVSICNKTISENGARPVWTLATCNPEAILLPRPEVRLRKGMLLFLDLGATYAGYHADMNRMAVAGRPSVEQLKTCENIAAITRATIKSIKPGIRASDTLEICRKEYQKVGLKVPVVHESTGYGPHRKIGHGIGLTLSEAPQLTWYDETVIEPGMTLCVEPHIRRYTTEQIVAVTDDGSETLSKADDRLYQV